VKDGRHWRLRNCYHFLFIHFIFHSSNPWCIAKYRCFLMPKRYTNSTRAIFTRDCQDLDPRHGRFRFCRFSIFSGFSRGSKGCKYNSSHPSRCAYDSSDTRMNDWITTMNIIRRATVKCRSGADQARLRGGRGGVGRKPPVKSEREPRRRGETQGRGEGPPGWLCDVIMLTKLFHCSAVYSDARIKAAEQWGGRDGESSEIGTRRGREKERERGELSH